jgi:hypothetical protein
MTHEKENGAGASGAPGGQKKIWMTLTGLPLTFTLVWPFHKSTSGADFWVLHGDILLENSDGLHAPVAVNLSETVREVLPSLEPKDVEIPAINALRKEVDRRQIEFLKSGKLLPVAFSSRHYDFKRQKWVFGKTTDETIEEFVERKVYWQTRLGRTTSDSVRVWIADPAEAQYLQTATETLLGAAARLAGKGVLRIDGEYATATDALMEQSGKFETAMRDAVEALEKKHAFERG